MKALVKRELMFCCEWEKKWWERVSQRMRMIDDGWSHATHHGMSVMMRGHSGESGQLKT
jgi:hypothetical protein